MFTSYYFKTTTWMIRVLVLGREVPTGNMVVLRSLESLFSVPGRQLIGVKKLHSVSGSVT